LGLVTQFQNPILHGVILRRVEGFRMTTPRVSFWAERRIFPLLSRP